MTRPITVMCYGGMAICPECSGLMKLQEYTRYVCADCRTQYQLDDDGIADREVTIKKVG